MLAARASTARNVSRIARSFATVVDGPAGIKVASLDYGQPTSAVTFLVKAGSRYESKPGVAHALKNFAFKVRGWCCNFVRGLIKKLFGIEHGEKDCIGHCTGEWIIRWCAFCQLVSGASRVDCGVLAWWRVSDIWSTRHLSSIAHYMSLQAIFCRPAYFLRHFCKIHPSWIWRIRTTHRWVWGSSGLCRPSNTSHRSCSCARFPFRTRCIHFCFST